MSKMSRACDITGKVRDYIYLRDNKQCIFCGNQNVQIAHFIPRSRGGLGIPENLACLCVNCHQKYDQSKYHNIIKKEFKEYLKKHYVHWDKQKLIYRKDKEDE